SEAGEPFRQVGTDAAIHLFAQRAGGIAQHLVLGSEVVLHQPLGDTRLGGDFAEAHPLQPAIGRDPSHRRRDELSALLVIDALGHPPPLSQYDRLAKTCRAFYNPIVLQKHGEDAWGSVDSSQARRARSTSRCTNAPSPPCPVPPRTSMSR